MGSSHAQVNTRDWAESVVAKKPTLYFLGRHIESQSAEFIGYIIYRFRAMPTAVLMDEKIKKEEDNYPR